MAVISMVAKLPLKYLLTGGYLRKAYPPWDYLQWVKPPWAYPPWDYLQ